MLNVTLTKAGPSREVVGFDAGANVTVSLTDGAVLEASFDVVKWTQIASVSGTVTLPTREGLPRVGVRFNLPTYPGHPVSVSVAEGG